MLTKQRHKNTCFCRRVRKYEELLFMCTLGIYILRGQLYDTSRSCPSICFRTVFNPSSLTEGRLQTSRQKHCFSKGGPGGTLPASVACRSIAGVVRRWWLLAQYLCLMLCLLQNVLFVCLFSFLWKSLKSAVFLSCPFTFWRLF